MNNDQRKVPRGLRLSVSLLLLLTLIACTPPAGQRNESTLTGTVASQRFDVGRSAAPGPQLAGLGVEELNRLIVAARAGGSSVAGATQPVRGFNAAWLRFLPQQQPDSLLAGQSVVALADDGEVLDRGTIAADGSFALTVPDGRQLALYQAREDGGLLCNRVMGYIDLDGTGKTVHWRPAFLNFDSAGAAAGSSVDVGDFTFSEHNASLGDEGEFADGSWTQIPAEVGGGPPSGDYQSCDNPDQTRALLEADFDIATPAGVDGATLYDFGLALALAFDAAGQPTFLGTGWVSSNGIVTGMNLSKMAGTDLPLTLVLSDAGLFDARKINYPLTPTAMLGAGPAAVSTVLGDGGHDFGVVGGAVARVFGTVREDMSGLQNPVPGAEVLGVLDSGDTLAINFAIADANGNYEMLLPIDQDEGYSIVATDPNNPWSGSPSLCATVCFLKSADSVEFDILVFDPSVPR